MILSTWHNTSGDWAQIHLKIVSCVDCVPLYWKFKMMLNGMWGAPCLQQGSALKCLIPGAPLLQMLYLEMTSHDLILFVKIYGHQVLTDGWYVLQYFGGLPLVVGTFHILAVSTSSPQIHAILYACLFLKSRFSNVTLWSCGLPVHCKPRGLWCIFHEIWIVAALQWFSVTIRYNHFLLLFFSIKWYGNSQKNTLNRQTFLMCGFC